MCRQWGRLLPDVLRGNLADQLDAIFASSGQDAAEASMSSGYPQQILNGVDQEVSAHYQQDPVQQAAVIPPQVAGQQPQFPGQQADYPGQQFGLPGQPAQDVGQLIPHHGFPFQQPQQLLQPPEYHLDHQQQEPGQLAIVTAAQPGYPFEHPQQFLQPPQNHLNHQQPEPAIVAAQPAVAAPHPNEVLNAQDPPGALPRPTAPCRECHLHPI